MTDEGHVPASWITAKARKGAPSAIAGRGLDPNVGFGGNVVLVAMRDVSPREELTTDYALFDDYEASMPCHRGSASCRGASTARIGGAPSSRRAMAGTSPGTSLGG